MKVKKEKRKKNKKKIVYVDDGRTVYNMDGVGGAKHYEKDEEKSGLTRKEKRAAIRAALETYLPVLGLVENMSYFVCPDCGKKIEIFGKSRFEETAARLGLKPIMRLPIDSRLAELSDSGSIEDVETVDLQSLWQCQSGT